MLSLYVWFLEGFDLLYVYNNIYIIYIHVITSWISMFNGTISRDTFPSFGLIRHIHDVINLFHYEDWRDKQKICTICICDTHNAQILQKYDEHRAFIFVYNPPPPSPRFPPPSTTTSFSDVVIAPVPFLF